MANFINRPKAGISWYPKPNDYVEGKYGKHTVKGIVLNHPKKHSEPWVFSTQYGCILCYILTDSGSKIAVNELAPVV